MQEFIQAMSAAGINTHDAIIADGELHRIHVEGDRKGSKNGYYVLYDDGVPAGAFGSWKLGIDQKWCEKTDKKMDTAQAEDIRRKLQAAIKQREKDQQAHHDKSAKLAQRIWDKAVPVEKHAYLETKQVKVHGLRYRAQNDSLVVPLCDSEGVIHTVQYIANDDRKKLLPGGKKAGHFHVIGESGKNIFLAEGYATAASVFEATGVACVVAVDSGNLAAVARAIRASYPEAAITIAADDDRHTPGNPGVTKATEAAALINATVVKPTFTDPESKGTDFNDLFIEEGGDAVKAQLLGEPIAVSEPLPLRRELPPSDPFPLGALGKHMAPAALAIKRVVQVPDALAGQSMLAAAALAVQGHADLLIDGRQSPLSEIFITVASTGERKSAADKVATRAHAVFQKQLMDDYRIDCDLYKTELAAWKKEHAECLNQNKSKGVKAKKKALQALGPEPRAPIVPIITCDEPTYEGLVMALATGWPSMGIFSDEGGRFVGGYSMSADQQVKTAAGLSSLWDGKPVSRMRSGDGAMLLYGRRVSMHIMVQPNISNLLFSNRMLIEQGLMSRALVAFPDTTIGDRLYVSENVLKAPAMMAYQSRMKAILETPLPIVEGEDNELEPRAITLDEDAKAVWVQFHDHIERLCKAGCHLASVRGFAAKAAEHAARIAGILTLVDDLDAKTIDQAHLKAGIELAQYYINEALRLFNGAQDDPDLLLAEELLGWIRGKRLSVVYARQVYHEGPNAIRNKNDAMRILKVLEDHRWIVPIEGGATVDGSHRKQAWRVWS